MASSRARYISILANTLNSSGKITSDNVLLPDSGVTAGSYGSASQVPVLTIDSKGRVTSASTTSVAGVTSFGYNTTSGILTIATADGGSFTAGVTLAPFSTTNLAEGTNQYFTTARARSSISASGSLSYNSTTGALTYTQDNTDTVAEGALNLYYTSARARGALSYTTGSAGYNSTSGQITIPSTTSHITEGSNLFYTDARARSAISGGTGVTYTSSTGTIAIGQSVGTTDNVTFGNVTVNGTLTSDDITSTNITASGNLTVSGNLIVSGTTTTVNSTTVSVADINIELARNATTAAQANGGGLTITGPTTAATLTYSSADDRWNFNKDLNVGRVYGNLTGAVTGNASTSTTLETTRSITATGDASWTVNFDGSTNVSAALTLANSGVTAGSYGSGTAIPVITVDSKGRITSASTSAVTIGDGAMTVTAGAGLTGGGQLGTANQTGSSSVTVSHADTSSVANQSAATNTFISGITFDTYGHVQTITTGSPSGFLTAESDTLATVTGRGASTSTASTFSGGLTSSGGLTITGSSTINTTTPGTTLYQLNFTGQATADYAQAITWGWSTSGPQAGIYVQSSGNYGTRMYLATTDSFATGSKTAVSIDSGGNVNITRGALQQGGNQVLHAGNYSSYALPLGGGTVTGGVTVNSGTSLPLQLATSSSGPWAITLTRTDLSASSSVFNSNGSQWYFQHRPSFVGNTPLDSGNYNSYSPSLTGSGASGTWGISISGNAATTSQRAFSSDISTTGQGRFTGWYTGNAATGIAAEIGMSGGQGYVFVYNRDTSTYGTLNIAASGANMQFSGSTINVSSGALQQGGNQVLHAGNYSSYALPLSGGALTGSLREARTAMGANNIDLSTGNYFTKTISGATSLTVSNVPSSGTAANFVLDLTNGGSAIITWWTGVKWPGGAAPTLTASGRDVLAFFTHDGGTTWTALVLGRDVK